MKPWMIRAIKIGKAVSQILLLCVSLFWFVFALLSGAQEYGGGVMGLVKNSPNAIPWLILLAFNYFIYKFNLIGGIALLVFAIFAFFQFDMYEKDGIFLILFIFLPLTVVSLFFIGYGTIIRRTEGKE